MGENHELDQEKKDFLLEIEYLMQQMAHNLIPLKVGYDQLMNFIAENQKKNIISIK